MLQNVDMSIKTKGIMLISVQITKNKTYPNEPKELTSLYFNIMSHLSL